MKRHHLLSISAITVYAALSGSAPGQQMGEHKIFTPTNIKWGPAPAPLPGGAQAAVLYGDPTKDETFALRLKVSKAYHIPPHTHPKPEIVTVVSGVVRLGMGATDDHGKAQVLPAGSFFALPPGEAHYFFADTDAVVQINGSGPWGIDYLDKKNDPRARTN